LHQQLENFRIPYSDFDFSNVSHMNLGIAPDFGRIARCIFKKSNCFAKSSPPPEKGTRPFECSSLATGGISLPDLAASLLDQMWDYWFYNGTAKRLRQQEE